MKAAPEAAISAVRVIARKLLRRIDIAKALVIAPKVADHGEYRVNPAGTGILVAEEPSTAQVRPKTAQDQTCRR